MRFSWSKNGVLGIGISIAALAGASEAARAAKMTEVRCETNPCERLAREKEHWQKATQKTEGLKAELIETSRKKYLDLVKNHHKEIAEKIAEEDEDGGVNAPISPAYTNDAYVVPKPAYQTSRESPKDEPLDPNDPRVEKEAADLATELVESQIYNCKMQVYLREAEMYDCQCGGKQRIPVRPEEPR